jgi:Cu/Ag efflux protein CusF
MIMRKATTLLLGALFLLTPPDLANQLSNADRGTVGVAMPEAAAMPKPATETMHGVVQSIDERNDTITLRLSPEKTQQFRVQDGLLFNAVGFGDHVEITVQDIAGAKTIVGLEKE